MSKIFPSCVYVMSKIASCSSVKRRLPVLCSWTLIAPHYMPGRSYTTSGILYCQDGNSKAQKYKLLPIKKRREKKVVIHDKVVGLQRTKADRYGYKRSKNKLQNIKEDDDDDIVLEHIDFTKVDLLPVHRASYTPSVTCSSRSPELVEIFRKKNAISCHGEDIPHPVLEFADCNFPHFIQKQITVSGFTSPLPIQSYAWPLALNYKDFVGLSMTGSGKTLAYIIPLLIHINNQERVKPGEGPLALVIAPTIELCEQLSAVTNSFISSTDITSVCLHGGAARESQLRILRTGVEICFATPGRLISLLYGKETNLLRCSFIVIDEADKIFDLGLDSQIQLIFSQCRPDRQTMMFTATWPSSLGWMVKEILNDRIELVVGSSELSTNPNIIQHTHVCKWREAEEKLYETLDLILEDKMELPLKILMFVNTLTHAEKYKDKINLLQKRFVVDVIHGDKRIDERTTALSRFRNGNVNFLIATDLAARGLDVADITHIISLGFPFTCEQYIHRIGRTGRAGGSGVAHTIIYKIEKDECSKLITVLEDHNQHVNPDLYQFLNVLSEKPHKKRFKWK